MLTTESLAKFVGCFMVSNYELPIVNVIIDSNLEGDASSWPLISNKRRREALLNMLRDKVPSWDKDTKLDLSVVRVGDFVFGQTTGRDKTNTFMLMDKADHLWDLRVHVNKGLKLIGTTRFSYLFDMLGGAVAIYRCPDSASQKWVLLEDSVFAIDKPTRSIVAEHLKVHRRDITITTFTPALWRHLLQKHDSISIASYNGDSFWKLAIEYPERMGNINDPMNDPESIMGTCDVCPKLVAW